MRPHLGCEYCTELQVLFAAGVVEGFFLSSQEVRGDLGRSPAWDIRVLLSCDHRGDLR